MPDIFGLQEQSYYPGVNLPYIRELLVVGNSDIDGNMWHTSNYDRSLPGLPNIYAPGVGIFSAEGNGLARRDGDYHLDLYSPRDGASFGKSLSKSSTTVC